VSAYKNKYWAMTFWANDTAGHYRVNRTERGTVFEMGEKYFNTVETRLHMFDGNEAQFKSEYIGESSIFLVKQFHTKPLQHYRFVHELHQGFIDPENPNLVRWTPPFVSPMSFVKVFEYVKGARIEGKTIFEGGSLTSYLVLTRKKQAKAPFDSSPLDQRLIKDWGT